MCEDRSFRLTLSSNEDTGAIRVSELDREDVLLLLEATYGNLILKILVSI